MRVIFLEDIPNQGNAGDLKNVADGYARNYLIPKGLATVATAEDMKRIERIKRAGDERRVRETEKLNDLAVLAGGYQRYGNGEGNPCRALSTAQSALLRSPRS